MQNKFSEHLLAVLSRVKSALSQDNSEDPPSPPPFSQRSPRDGPIELVPSSAPEIAVPRIPPPARPAIGKLERSQSARRLFSRDSDEQSGDSFEVPSLLKGKSTGHLTISTDDEEATPGSGSPFFLHKPMRTNVDHLIVVNAVTVRYHTASFPH